MGALALQAAGDFARDKELKLFRQIIEDVA